MLVYVEMLKSDGLNRVEAAVYGMGSDRMTAVEEAISVVVMHRETENNTGTSCITFGKGF